MRLLITKQGLVVRLQNRLERALTEEEKKVAYEAFCFGVCECLAEVKIGVEEIREEIVGILQGSVEWG